MRLRIRLMGLTVLEVDASTDDEAAPELDPVNAYGSVESTPQTAVGFGWTSPDEGDDE